MPVNARSPEDQRPLSPPSCFADPRKDLAAVRMKPSASLGSPSIRQSNVPTTAIRLPVKAGTFLHCPPEQRMPAA